MKCFVHILKSMHTILWWLEIWMTTFQVGLSPVPTVLVYSKKMIYSNSLLFGIWSFCTSLPLHTLIKSFETILHYPLRKQTRISHVRKGNTWKWKNPPSWTLFLPWEFVGFGNHEWQKDRIDPVQGLKELSYFVFGERPCRFSLNIKLKTQASFTMNK